MKKKSKKSKNYLRPNYPKKTMTFGSIHRQFISIAIKEVSQLVPSTSHSFQPDDANESKKTDAKSSSSDETS